MRPPRDEMRGPDWIMQGDHCCGMPRIRSGGQGKHTKWIMVVSTVRSLMAGKWDVTKAIVMRLHTDVFISEEVLFDKATVNLEDPGYHTIRGLAAGRGKMIVMWIRQVPGERCRTVRDGRHSLAVVLHGRHTQHLVGIVHMHQRKEAVQYVKEAEALMALAEQYVGVPMFIFGD